MSLKTISLFDSVDITTVDLGDVIYAQLAWSAPSRKFVLQVGSLVGSTPNNLAHSPDFNHEVPTTAVRLPKSTNVIYSSMGWGIIREFGTGLSYWEVPEEAIINA